MFSFFLHSNSPIYILFMMEYIVGGRTEENTFYFFDDDVSQKNKNIY